MPKAAAVEQNHDLAAGLTMAASALLGSARAPLEQRQTAKADSILRKARGLLTQAIRSNTGVAESETDNDGKDDEEDEA